MTHATPPAVPGTREEPSTFRTPGRLDAPALADTVARLVWESYSDLVSGALEDGLLGSLGISDEKGLPDEHGAKEALIFVVWAHTRAIQMAFHDRAAPTAIRRALDALHAAVFEDLVEHGMPRAALPLFEQRVSARYQEYYQASELSDAALGAAVVRRLRDGSEAPDPLVATVVERARAIASPLKDYLAEVELDEIAA